MKISVIVPVYNCGEYLSDCLDSILGQTYQNFEIILIDDGSQDCSGAICDAYGAKDSRIRVIHQKNHGVSHARNTGLTLATGDAISFIDGDDTLEPDMYELLVKTMQEHEADIAHCGFFRVEHNSRKPIYGTKAIHIHDKEEAVGVLLKGNLFNGALWNKLFRVHITNGLSFREELKINEDILFCFEAFGKAEKSVFADYAKYNYFVRENVSACFTTASEKKRMDSLWVSAYIYEKLAGTTLERYAADRYLRGLSREFRFCRVGRKKQAERIWHIYRSCPEVSSNMQLTAKLIRFVPFVYTALYEVYDRVRKPVWEV